MFEHLRSCGRWYGFGGLLPIFLYEREDYHGGDPSIERTASIIWLRQRFALSWQHGTGWGWK